MLADEFDKKRLADELTQEDITKYQGHLYVEQKEGGTTVYRRIEDPSGNMISYMKGVAIGAQTTVEGKQSVAIGAGANAKAKIPLRSVQVRQLTERIPPQWDM